MSNSTSHIFLFPFRWKLNLAEKKKNTALFSEITDLETANNLVLQDSERWSTDLYKKFKDHEDYNEFIYFYPFVRSVLYDYQDEPDRNILIKHYSFLPAAAKQLQYIINIKNDKRYRLNIDFILLNLYTTGVGLLSFHLKNDFPDQQDWDDLLKINEYGRRIYPQFLSENFSFSNTKNAFLANSIEIINTDILPVEGLPIIDDFEADTGISAIHSEAKPYKTDVIPNHIDKILPRPFREAICIEPVLDDRMFVVSAYSDAKDEFSGKIKSLKADVNGKLVSEFNKQLYKYIFVDGPFSSGVGNEDFRDELLKNHSYSRWFGEATFIGVSRYSFVTYSNWSLIPVHTRTMYYKMAELCLVQRASILTFTEEISRISKLNKNTRLLAKQLNDLYKNYIQFVNKIYFREVTAQEQGIELYNMIQEKMGLREEVKSLDEEIEELHNYVMMEEETTRNRNIAFLTKIATAFIVPGFIAAYLSVNVYEVNDLKYPDHKVLTLLLILGFMVIVPAILLLVTRKDRQIRTVEIIISAIILIIILIVLPLIIYK